MRSLETFLTRSLTGLTIVGMLVATAGIRPALAADDEPTEAAQDAPKPQPPDEKTPEATGDQTAAQAEAAAQEKKEEAKEGQPVVFTQEIVVKGYRQSLQQSVELKRDAVNVRDSIVTEDISKMPDLNIAEAIQRVPGVAIVREGGEGRNISLRGLGPEFTQVTLNGMEVPASTGGLDSSGGVNRGRTFDFNVFSAELFNRIDIDKTAVASIEEGGMAGTVQMYTSRPLATPGFRGTASLQGGWNDLSKKSDPRATLTLSSTNKAETLGFILSGAYTERTPYQDGFGTVRWAQPDRPFAGNETDLSDEELNSLWYPRLPRQDSFRHEQKRLGLAAALQYRPNDQFELVVNWVHSKFDDTVNSYNSFAQFRRSGSWGYPTITPIDVTVAEDGTGLYAIAGTFDNVALRTESRQQVDATTFNQYTANMEYKISDTLRLSGMIGQAESDFMEDYFRANIETLTGTQFSYDFTANPNVAMIHYGIDVTDPANYQIQDNELFQRFGVDRTNKTARVDFEWEPADRNVVKFGGIYNDRNVESLQWVQNVPPPSDLAAISKVFDFVDAGGFGSDTTLDFLVLDFDKAKAAYGYGDFTLLRGPGRQTWDVKEKTTGVYAEYDLFALFGEHSLRLNAGLRFVNTDTEATGWLTTDLSNTETNSYNNFLPAVNVAYDLTPKLLLRGAVSRTMTRPSLSSLAPIKSYSDVNFTVSGGNSQLEPLESDNFDIGLEWYFAKQSVVAVTFFYKDIKSFIQTQRTQEPLRSEDYPAVAAVYPTQPALLDPTLIWTYNTPANVDGTNLNGFEIAYQQPFTSLPGILSNFGFVGNYSYVDSETEVTRDGEIVKVPLEGLSKHSWNATLYYEVPAFGIRLSVNNRDDYITNNTGSNGNVAEATTGPVRYDMSAFYHINDAFSLTLEGVNLTNEPERLYTTGNGTMNLVREYNHSGRQFYAGLRFNF